MVRNYVPAKNGLGTVGLYELCSGEFYTNLGTGEFTPGAVIPGIVTISALSGVTDVKVNTVSVVDSEGVANVSVDFSTLAGSPDDNLSLRTILGQKLNANTAIQPNTKCKITYDMNGLVTGGSNLQASDIPNLTLSKITDVTATATEVNYTSGVTSAIQTQLNNKEPADTTILKKANVINNVTSTNIDLPLSANQGKVLQTEINNLKNIGRFLAILDSSAGTVSSQPSGSVGDTYAYKVGDYYRVGAAGAYGPKGTATYTIDATSGSSNFEQGETSYGIGDVIYCSNLTETTSTWVRQASSGGGTVQDVQKNGVSVLNGGIANVIVPTKTSDITNDSGYTNASEVQAQIQNYHDSTKQDAIDSSHKLSSDLVDDTNHTNKFVNDTEKTTWNNKQDSIQVRDIYE